jgi:phage gp36-like protein
MYIDKSYILQRIPQERLNVLTNSTDANLEAAINSASSLIDTYIRTSVKTIPIPAEQISETIKRICFDITIYYLHDRADYLDVPEAVQTKYDSSIQVLEDILSNKITLDKILEVNIEESVEYGTNISVFNRNNY